MKGKIDIAYARSVGDVIILLAECWAIHCDGIRIERNKKIRNIKVESDAIQVIRAINR